MLELVLLLVLALVLVLLMEGQVAPSKCPPCRAGRTQTLGGAWSGWPWPKGSSYGRPRCPHCGCPHCGCPNCGCPHSAPLGWLWGPPGRGSWRGCWGLPHSGSQRWSSLPCPAPWAHCLHGHGRIVCLRVLVCVCVPARVQVFMLACARVCVCVCACMCVCTCA